MTAGEARLFNRKIHYPKTLISRTEFYAPYTAIIDYGDGMKVCSDSTTGVILFRADIDAALAKRITKNGYIPAAFNNIGLSDKLSLMLRRVETCIDLIETELGYHASLM